MYIQGRVAEFKGQLAEDVYKEEEYNTLNLEPIDENFDDFDDSSAKSGNSPETKEHSEALKSA